MGKDATFGLERWQMAVIVCCVAGLLSAVYFIWSPDGNQDKLATALQAPAPAREMTIPDKVTKELATGKLAAFLVKPERRPVADVDFLDETGERRSIADWRGRVVLLNLWATWCAPCRKEMPELAELQRKLGGDAFEVVALSVDRKGAEASAKFLIEANAASLRLYIDRTADAVGKLQAIGLPATILIDRQGREIGRLLGPADWASDDALRLIATAIAEGQPRPAAKPEDGLTDS